MIKDFKRIPKVIAVESEVLKATAILGALPTGVIHALATRVSIATAVM